MYMPVSGKGHEAGVNVIIILKLFMPATKN